ncbi:MAG: PIN domain-containing protein [Campylobacterota bacterium]|nr:PIN domain-containing protein [Campylobacterota bacterium]
MKIKKIFFDANIFNDIFDENRVNHKSSKEALIYALQNDITVCTSCDIVTNIYYITAKYTSATKALDALSYLKEVTQIIPFAQNELDTTIKLMQNDSDYKDLEDAIQYTLALEENCDLIITNDKKFVSKKLKCVTSFEYIA